MKDWLKFIGLSFFSDDIAKSAAKRGIGNIIFAAFMTVVFLLLGAIFATVFTFEANYVNTPELAATVEAAFSSDMMFEINAGKLNASAAVDTVKNDTDKSKYYRGYDIIIDTRDANTFDEFTAYCESKSGKRISYEEYLNLDADIKTLYTFGIEYSGKERVIDDEWVEKCETYLGAAQDKTTADAYAEVKKLPATEYRFALYNLYVKTYYPDLSAYETGGNAPKTRNYYYHEYGNRSKTVYFFNDSAIGLYETKYGAAHVFYGYYSDMADGAIGKSADEIRRFIFDCADGAASIVVYNCVMNFFMLIPFTVVIVLAEAVLLFCLTKLLKLEDIKFGAAAKTECSFLLVSSLISALITFGLGFLVSETLIYWLIGVALFAVLSVRTAVMLIRDCVKKRRTTESEVAAHSEISQSEKGEKTAEKIAEVSAS